MSGEVTVPLLPCADIDVVADFYGALGFTATYRQLKPNPYVALRRDDIHLHFFGMDGFDPAQSYGSCLVQVADTGVLYEAFAAGMRARYGKVLTAGVPRMTRPRRKQDHTMGFVVVDPGGNWIRIVRGQATSDERPPAGPAAAPTPVDTAADAGARADGDGDGDAPTSRLARSLYNAVVLGDSKGDDAQAARILDGALRREECSETPDRVAAIVYRLELAIRLGQGERADELLVDLAELSISAADRALVAADLEHAQALAQLRTSDSSR